MAETPYVPEYSKPDAPGIWMNFDNTVSVYHVVGPDDTFEKAAQDLFGVVKEAQEQFPDWPRLLYVDIVGHIDNTGRFSEDFVEFQQEFMFSTVAVFVTALELPLTGPLLNPNPQRNDFPDSLGIKD
ncbi:MAG: hypothetical protein AAGJ10_10545 [Bacteroidota bacterium]